MKLKICEKCSKNFETKDNRTRFCGHSCAASYRNTGISRNRKKPIQSELCLFCNSPLNDAYRYKKYCNSTCSAEGRKKLYIDNWILSPEKVFSSHGLPAAIREYLLKEANYTCSSTSCGWSGFNSVTGRSTLQVDHINGDAMDNRPENLRVICPNCHSLSPNWCALNKGNSTRKNYYKKLK